MCWGCRLTQASLVLFTQTPKLNASSRLAHEGVRRGHVDVCLPGCPLSWHSDNEVLLHFTAGAIARLPYFISGDSFSIPICQESALGLFRMKNTVQV